MAADVGLQRTGLVHDPGQKQVQRAGDRDAHEAEQAENARAAQPLRGERVFVCIADRLGRLHHGGHEGRAYAMRAWGNKDTPPGEALSCRRLDTLG